MASQPQSAGPVSYEPLKAWIFDQEEYQRRFGQPAPLTDEQRLAMAVLVPQPPPPQLPTHIGGDSFEKNWVSLLTHYTQIREGEFVPAEFQDEQLPPNSLGSPQWRTRCRLSREAAGEWFPELNERRPQDSIFQTKKAAKQHAARCAVEWLIAHGQMSMDGNYITPPRSYQPVIANTATRNTTVESTATGWSRPVLLDSTPSGSESPTSQLNQTTTAPNVLSMASWRAGTGAVAKRSSWKPVLSAADNGISTTNTLNGPNGKGGNNGRSEKLSQFRGDGDEYEDVSNLQRLDALCKMLKIGSPSYELETRNDGTEGIFSGRIVFPSSSSKGGSGIVPALPDGVGEVRDVYTKKAARERIAQSVLQYLLKNILGSDEGI